MGSCWTSSPSQWTRVPLAEGEKSASQEGGTSTSEERGTELRRGSTYDNLYRFQTRTLPSPRAR